MNASKRWSVIKRRFFNRLILKTQQPEYYSRLQSQVRELQREKQSLEVHLSCALNNEQYWREKHAHLLNRVQALKAQRRSAPLRVYGTPLLKVS